MTIFVKNKTFFCYENMYKQYYDGLVRMGYYARFGQNTFSLDPNDCGVSPYLRSRMLMGVPYKGFARRLYLFPSWGRTGIKIYCHFCL